jgi:hypothetical protein
MKIFFKKNLISLSKKCFYWVVSQVSAAKHPNSAISANSANSAISAISANSANSVNSGKKFASLVKSTRASHNIVLLIYVFLFFGMCLLGLLGTSATMELLRQFISCFASKPLAYCMKRDSDSDHSDGSPQKRSRISQNENIGTEQPITLEEVSKMPEIRIPKVPGDSSRQWQTEGKADMKPPYFESTPKAAANANLEEARSTVSEAKSVSIQAINPESLESNDELKLTVQTTLDIVSDIASATTKVMEAAIATEAVKKFTAGRGASKDVALACGALAGVSVLLTDERVKKLGKDFLCYQIDTVTTPGPQDPVDKPPSPADGDNFCGDVAPFHFVPSAFEGHYLNTEFLYNFDSLCSFGVQFTTFLFISILVNEKRVTLCKWARGLAKYSPSFSKFVLGCLETPILSHGTGVRLLSCLILIITFGLLRYAHLITIL